MEQTGLSYPTIASAVDILAALGITRSFRSRRRRFFVYDRYLGILNEGTET